MSIATDKLNVFVNQWQTLSGVKLRQPTAGTLLILEQSNNLLLLDSLPKIIEDKTVTGLDLISPVSQYVMLHSLPLNEVRGMAGDDKAISNAMFAAADSIPAEAVVEYALAINEALRAMKQTRDWEVAGQNGDPFTRPNGPLSTLSKSPS